MTIYNITSLILSLLLLTTGCLSSSQSVHIIEWTEEPPVANEDLQQLINSAIENEADTLFVPFGTYILTASVSISQAHELCIFFQPGTRVLHPETLQSIIIIDYCSDVTIQNGYFSHLVPIEGFECTGACVEIMNSTNTRIENCVICGCGAIGVSLSGTMQTQIDHCLIQDNTLTAILINRSVDGLSVTNCIIRNNGSLFYMNALVYTPHEDTMFATVNMNSLNMSGNLIMNNKSEWEGDTTPYDPGLNTLQ